MSEIAKAYVQVIPSAKGISTQLKSVFEGEGNSAGGSFGSSLIGKVKTIIAAAGIGKAIGESLSAGADLQQSLGGIETLFKDSASTVIANAEQAYKTVGMSANSYMEQVTSFSASLLQSLGGDTAAAAESADMALREIRQYEMQNFLALYEAYKVMRGNSFIDEIHEEVTSWEIIT